MGQTWMRQTALNNSLLAQLAGVVSLYHHRFGVAAQEEGYYIDVKAQLSADFPKHAGSSARNPYFKSIAYLGSALEHGVLEQLQVGRPAASTVKLLQMANEKGHKIYLANKYNYSSVRPRLAGYTPEDKDDIEADLAKGAMFILPAKGNLRLKKWVGKGYIRYQTADSLKEIGMIIGGGYNGGYAGDKRPIDTGMVVNDYVPELKDKSNISHSESREPIDLVTGAYLYDRTDISLGPGEPRGLGIKRSYNSLNRNIESVLPQMSEKK